MKRLTVLQFIPSLNRYDGGTTTYMQQLAPELGKEVDLHVCALTPVSDFVELENCVPHSIPLSMLHWREMKRAWISLLDEIQPDVVHFNCCWMPQIAAVIHWTHVWNRQGSHFRTLLTPHGMLEPWILNRNYWTRKLPAIWLYQRRALQEVDIVVATAQSEIDNLRKLGWNDNLSLVQNGILVDGIEPKQAWKNRRRLLFMSRIHQKKGLELLFGAIEALSKEGIDFTVQIAGDGDPAYVESLKKTAPRNVSFLGPVYGPEKWRLIRESDVVVLPSFSENYGLIVAESLASATPVITTTGTPWRCIAERNAGWWTDPSVPGIAEALREFASLSDSQLETLGNNARELAEEECNISKTTQLLMNLYTKNDRK